ncbi:MAG: 50S ribosomal protein L29 [Chloroflexi bacterium]|nr:50S ribosomal protein L29 [Chloroflexota bacterium]MYF79496.1 50S ribosomal protein L29 [Chloroflexota bacterium]MYK60595.1 50S ribosomal protein L29 [Chloroflexota bacterium]
MHISEVRELNNNELWRELQEQERSLMNLRFQKTTRQLTNTNALRDTRRNIARIHTVIRERQIVEQLGLGEEGSS